MSFAADDKETQMDSDREPDSDSTPGASKSCQTKPREKRPVSTIRLLKEDFDVFKQDFINIFRDKDEKKPETKDKRPLSGLKEDLNQFREDLSGILRKGLRKEDAFRVRAQDQTGQRGDAEKEDQTGQDQTGQRGDTEKEDQTGQDQTRKGQMGKAQTGQDQTGQRGDAEKEDQTGQDQTGKDQTGKDQKGQDQTGKDQTGKDQKRQDQTGQRGDTEKEDQTGQRGDAEKEDQTGQDQTGKDQTGKDQTGKDQTGKAQKGQDQTGQRGDAEKEEDRADIGAESWELVGEDELEQDEGTLEEKLEVKEKKDGGAVPAKNTDAQSCERDARCDGGSKMMDKDENLSKEEEEDTVLGQESLISLSSGISLLRLRDISQNQQRGRLKGDVWSVKNFAQYLTLDPNTANPELLLSDGNRTARRVWGRNHVTVQVPDQLSDHPERFECCPQVLCREGLLDAVYWEVEWTGGADVGVTYNSIARRGQVRDGLLGHNQGSWSLECSEGSYTPCHCQRRFRSVSPQPFSRTVGVFLDFEAGSLSFYCVSPEAMLHLHTFSSTFTEPLYPGFWLWAWGGSVSLSQVKLDWERLLQ